MTRTASWRSVQIAPRATRRLRLFSSSVFSNWLQALVIVLAGYEVGRAFHEHDLGGPSFGRQRALL